MTEKEAVVASPFPGMDPYLEAAHLWPDFHSAMAAEIRAQLNANLPAPYYARLQRRAELGIILEGGSFRRIFPDVSVVRQVREQAAVWEASADVVTLPRTTPSPGVDLRIPTDPLYHHFVEIRDAGSNHKLITVIEILSPSNKQPGPDAKAYRAKQEEVLGSDANLIEIDLLRDGTRQLPYPELEAAVDALAPDYLVLINRSALRQGLWMDYTLYPIKLREILPCIPVPLAGQDPDVLLDLQLAFIRVYQEGLYSRSADYSVDPDPPLSPQDAAWVRELRTAKR